MAYIPGLLGRPRHHPVLLGLVSVVVLRSAYGLSLDGDRVVEGINGSSDFLVTGVCLWGICSDVVVVVVHDDELDCVF